jgi:hypothetical protein
VLSPEEMVNFLPAFLLLMRDDVGGSEKHVLLIRICGHLTVLDLSELASVGGTRVNRLSQQGFPHNFIIILR